jgi:dimethylargininase
MEPGPFDGFRTVVVPAEEPRAAEVMRVNRVVCMHDGFPRTRELVDSLGVEVRAVDLSEFVKAEAGPTCLSLLLSRDA